MSRKKLKMFVWQGPGVLQDYSSGMICALAFDLEQAVKLIREKMGYDADYPVDKYKVVEEPEAFCCYGGG